jgi:hypothetical protein
MVRGGHALVSVEDYDRLSKFRWRIRHVDGRQYVIAHKPGTDKGSLQMHRLVVNAQPGQIVDHKDGNGCNNSRENLRVCSTAENIRNQRVHVKQKSHSKFKGVYRQANGRWRAQIMVQYKKKNLGTFPDEIAAARAYDAAAKNLHGDFARLNFPEAA